jgi:hypothetical protein
MRYPHAPNRIAPLRKVKDFRVIEQILRQRENAESEDSLKASREKSQKAGSCEVMGILLGISPFLCSRFALDNGAKSSKS